MDPGRAVRGGAKTGAGSLREAEMITLGEPCYQIIWYEDGKRHSTFRIGKFPAQDVILLLQERGVEQIKAKRIQRDDTPPK